MTKRCIRIAYKSDTDEKEVKIGRVWPLLGIPRTWVKAHVRRQDPAYAGSFART